MTDSFATRLARSVRDAGSPLCVGLDPDLARIPASGSESDARAAEMFCIAITDSTAHVAAAYKPNLAFFEALGPDGWHALAAVCEHVRSTGRLLILDGKRGDIGNTGQRYATALYDRLGGDAATVAPYMGADSLTPFLGHAGRCAFVLVATSNPGAVYLQHFEVEGQPLYRTTARMIERAAEGQAGEAGFVVGATQPGVLAELREAHPSIPFLVPGVGAQGGSVSDVLAANAGGPILINSSRSILYASCGPDFADAATRAAEDLSRQLASADNELTLGADAAVT